jgi:predicted SpoU family rRNA methylase
VAVSDDQDLGYTRICAGLSARFGTRFTVETTGECITIVAKFEGGIEVMITDCGVSLSPVGWHLDGRGSGYYVGIHRVVADESGADTEDFEQVGYACDVDALPTVEAIGELVHQALAYARFLSVNVGQQHRYGHALNSRDHSR